MGTMLIYRPAGRFIARISWLVQGGGSGGDRSSTSLHLQDWNRCLESISYHGKSYRNEKRDRPRPPADNVFSRVQLTALNRCSQPFCKQTIHRVLEWRMFNKTNHFCIQSERYYNSYTCGIHNISAQIIHQITSTNRNMRFNAQQYVLFV